MGEIKIRLDRLRRLMHEQTVPLAAYIIPTDDAHQSEYIAECDKRRAFVSGFTGSAGIAVVTKEQALLWTDGRYHLQASQQLDSALWTLMRQGNDGVPTPGEWLAANISKGSVIGFDPNLISEAAFLKYSEGLEDGCGPLLLSVEENLVDKVWGNSRPPVPNSDLIILGEEFSGRVWQEKINDVRKEMRDNEVSVLVVTALDEIAWLFNMRGADINYNPVFFSYGIVTTEDVRLYMLEDRIKIPTIRNHLKGAKLFPYCQVKSDLQELISIGSKIWISKQSAHAFVRLVPKSQLCSLISPIQMLKGIKNTTEIEGMRMCQIRDSAAVCEYLHWLEEEVPKGYLNEVSAADKLETFRRELQNFVSLSFPTISSSGPNGAIIHYCPVPETARKLSTRELYLCDSGAQYLDGTTDITRTVSFGEPSLKEKECFTLVLKGHIGLCSAVFPDKTMGNQLDYLARHALWDVGLDYKHGTGHGVGSFLNVHEGPHGISKTRPYSKPLQSGMFVTDEPGYYEDGVFGMRIENVELVKEVETKYHFNAVNLSMEPLTLVPIQLKMISISLLTMKEIEWLNNYHATCLRVVGEYLVEKGKMDIFQWLQRETQPVEMTL